MLFASCVAVRTLLAETRTFHSLSIARAGGWCVWGPPPRRHANLLGLHTSACVRGLEEFFPKSDDLIDEGEKAGRSWKRDELRQKSFEDLHKLWYVLLKERNMLLTLKHDARRAGFLMPAPERAKKVRKSMANIKLVISERDRAVAGAKRLMEEQPGTPAEDQEETTTATAATDSENIAIGTASTPDQQQAVAQK